MAECRSEYEMLGEHSGKIKSSSANERGLNEGCHGTHILRRGRLACASLIGVSMGMRLSLWSCFCL